jgi:hypothetical protein
MRRAAIEKTGVEISMAEAAACLRQADAAVPTAVEDQ